MPRPPPVTRNWSELSDIKALAHSGRSAAPGCIYPMATSAGRGGHRRPIHATFQVQVSHLSDMVGEDRSLDPETHGWATPRSSAKLEFLEARRSPGGMSLLGAA